MKDLTIKVKHSKKIHTLSLKENGGIIQLINVNGRIYMPILGDKWITVEVIGAELK